MNRYLKIRWLLFSLAIVAVTMLTAMNIYSLYSLHEATITTSTDIQKNQLADFSYTVRNRFRQPVEAIWRLNMEQIDEELDARLPLNRALGDILHEASRDPMYRDIYFTYPEFSECGAKQSEIYWFDPDTRDLQLAEFYPETVCDGFGMSRTRMRVLISDYRWNTKVVFDTHRSMTVAMINPREQEVVGYLNFVFNQEFLVRNFLASELTATFGPREESGMVIWLHDWLKNEVLATNDSSVDYDRRSVQYIQRFPDLLDNWNLKVKFDEGSTILASRASLIRNLIVLTGGVLLLITSLIIIFRMAQKERELAERQSGFLANVTHELKTPLAVMQAAGENLSDGRVKDPSRLKSYGDHIYTESIRLRRMIDKLLDVAKADSGQLMLKPEVLSLSSLVQGYLQQNDKFIRESGFIVNLSVSEEPLWVHIDKDSFTAIFTNLLENAIKYSPDNNHIGIRIFRNAGYIQLDVEDNGLGIPPKAQKHIFDKFYRVEDPLTARTKGHGLGLSIVKTLVQLNGGRIFVQSAYREGSVFSVQFPEWKKEDVQVSITQTSEATVEYVS